MEIDFAIGGGGRERAAGEAIGLAENRRAEISDGIRNVDVVENVASVHAKRQIVAIVRRAPTKHTAAIASAAVLTSSAAAGAAAERTAGWAAGPASSFLFFSEAESFSEPEIQSEAPGSSSVIDGNNGLPRDCHRAEAAVARVSDSGAAGGTAGRRRTRVEYGIAE